MIILKLCLTFDKLQKYNILEAEVMLLHIRCFVTTNVKVKVIFFNCSFNY